MKRAFEVSEELYPFESRWLEVDGIPVHYIDEGQGKPILFCHGNPTWSFLYRDIIRDLTQAGLSSKTTTGCFGSRSSASGQSGTAFCNWSNPPQ